MLRQRIAGIAGMVLGILIVIQAALALANENVCQLFCPAGLIYSNEFLIAFGLVILGISAGLLVVNERRERRTRSQPLETKSGQKGVG